MSHESIYLPPDIDCGDDDIIDFFELFDINLFM